MPPNVILQVSRRTVTIMPAAKESRATFEDRGRDRDRDREEGQGGGTGTGRREREEGQGGAHESHTL
jgi:hypothetical protein